MIEVIKNNARNEFECSNCKSVIAYDPIDVRECSAPCNWYSFVKCPICGEEYVVEKVDALVPKRLTVNDSGHYCNIYNCSKCGKQYDYEKRGFEYWRNRTPFICDCGEKIYIGE